MQQINNLSEHLERYQEQVKAALNRVVESGWFVLGPEVNAFEEEFAAYNGVAHCVSVANGTDALEIGLRTLGVGAQSVVATVANAGMYTGSALITIGAEPYFMDVDLDTSLLTLREVDKAIQAGVDAVVVTHLYGFAVPDIQQIAQLCARHNVLLLEDCAQAHGAMVNGQRVGSFGDLACFSFYPTKNLGAIGDGGAIITRHAANAERAKMLRQYGWTKKYTNDIKYGRNSRLDELQAAVLREFLPLLDSWNERRRAVACLYQQLIRQDKVQLLPNMDSAAYVGHLFVIRCDQRDSLMQHLRSHGVAVDIHYPIPDHQQQVFAVECNHTRLANTELLAEQILTLPCYPELAEEHVRAIVGAVNGWQS